MYLAIFRIYPAWMPQKRTPIIAVRFDSASQSAILSARPINFDMFAFSHASARYSTAVRVKRSFCRVPITRTQSIDRGNLFCGVYLMQYSHPIIIIIESIEVIYQRSCRFSRRLRWFRRWINVDRRLCVRQMNRSAEELNDKSV